MTSSFSSRRYSPITFSDQFAKFNARQNNHVYGIVVLEGIEMKEMW